jgi:hypothetical protein
LQKKANPTVALNPKAQKLSGSIPSKKKRPFIDICYNFNKVLC